MSRESDFITEARQHNRALWDALNALETLQKEWNALDYGTTLDAGEGENADVGAVVFGTADALRTVLNSGHATNMAKLL